MTKKIISLAISLLVVVISLTGVALGAGAPTTTVLLSRYTPGFQGAPGKMARDAAGNFYVTDFWGKGIVKLDKNGNRIGFVATLGRPSAVAVLPDSRLVVALLAPQPKVAFYNQVTGEEDGVKVFGPSTTPLYRPSAITAVGAYIYVLDTGDLTSNASVNVPKIRVYEANGTFRYEIGLRTSMNATSTTLDTTLKHPSGIAYEKAGNKIAVVDSGNCRLVYYTPYDGASMTASSFVGRCSGSAAPALSPTLTFGSPVDVAFEYDATPTLQRVYVVERGKGNVTVLDGTTNLGTKYIDGSTVAGATMRFPKSVLFEKAADGGGVLYVNSEAMSQPASILKIGIDRATAPASPVTLAITTPVAATVTSATLPLSGTVSPARTVKCNVNGGTDVTATGSWNASVTLVAGDNFVVCRTEAANEVPAYAEVYTYFAGAPSTASVSINQPVANFVTKEAMVTLSGTSTNAANATVKAVNSNGGANAVALTDAAGNWSLPITLAAADGNNPITVTVSKPGVLDGSDAVTVIRDNTAPTVSIAFLANAATANTAVQNIDGIVSDPNLGSINLGNIVVNNEVVPASAKVTMADGSTYFSVPVTLVRGTNTVSVKATDLAGKFTVVERTVTLNPEKPGITVAAPADNSYRPSAGSVPVNGDADSSFAAVNAYAVSGGTWSGSLAVNPGFQAYPFVTTGGTPNVSVKRSINANVAYAQLAITSPPADKATKDDSIVIAGNVASGSAKPTISINGGTAVDVSTYNPLDGAFSHTVDLSALGQGVHSVKVIANAATTAVRNIVYDTTLPDLTIQADNRAMPSTITGAIEPSAKISAITASLNSSPVTIPVSVVSFDAPAGGSVVWRANLSGRIYDAISFTTEDPAGNARTLSFDKGIPTGDVDQDGAVRLSDALATLRHVAGTQALVDGSESFKQADVGSLVEGHAARDGVVDIIDSQIILEKAYGLLTF